MKVDPTDLVTEFHVVFNHLIRSTPILDIPERQLRVDLIVEECQEYVDAEKEGDLTAMADAMGDIIYVVYGAALAHGIDLGAVLLEIQKSNLSKLDVDGKPILRSDGKILKGPNYRKPDLRKVLGI